MKLISCHIENFGKLSNRTYEFQNGLNCICEENGWGKSTLATFIRVMFYGFLNEKARKGVANERKRYKSWQGGAYGGRLTFETNGTIYEIERTFGARENEDTFTLRDKSTNMISNAYTKNIGEELFKIDVNSFMRTAYISQNDCVTSTTDGINAKIGNLAENTDDINNFETVDKRLTDLLNSMSPTRKTGSIARLKDEIGNLTVEIKNASELDRTIDEYIVMREQKKKEYEELREKQSELANEKKRISRLNDERLLREKYRAVCEDYEGKKQVADTLRSFFNGRVPDEEELDSYLSEVTKLSADEKTMKVYELSDEETTRLARLNKVFENGNNVPEKSEIEDSLRKISELQATNVERAKYEITAEEEQSLERLQGHFEESLPNESDIDYNIDRFMMCSEKKNSLATRKAALHSMKSNLERQKTENKRRLEEEQQQKEQINEEKREKKEELSQLKSRFSANKKKALIFTVLGTAFVILGIILALISEGKTAGLGLIMAGAVFFVLTGVSNSNKSRLKSEMRKLKAELEKLEVELKRISELRSSSAVESDSEAGSRADNPEENKAENRADNPEDDKTENKAGNKTDSDIADNQERSITLLESEIIQDEALIQSFEKEILAFIKKYHYSDGDNNGETTAKLLYSMKSDMNEYKRLLSKKENVRKGQYDNQAEQIGKQIQDFIGRYYDMADITPLQYEQAIHSIDNDLDNFRSLLQKQNSHRQAQSDYEEGLKKVKQFLAKTDIKKANDSEDNIDNNEDNGRKDSHYNDNTNDIENLSRLLLEIKGHLHQYLLAKQQMEDACHHKVEFENDNRDEIANFENVNLNSEYSMQDIDDAMEKIAKDMEQIREGILDYNNKLNEFREKRDDISEKQETLKLLNEKYESDMHQYKLLKATKELLEKAKNSFTAKYMEPVMSGFVKYYHIIDGGDTSAFRIDARTNLTVDEKGMQRETIALSTGKQDLIGICMRMALINAMYTEEKPFVIFDDPFVNLDDDRVKGGTALLERISDEYQIIYFTCHESRAYSVRR